MSDWESKKVESLELECGILFSDDQYDTIAAALRSAYHRGRVAGLREAAKLLKDCGECDASDHEDELNELADKLEAETP